MATLDTRPDTPISALRDAVAAPVLLPGDDGWDAARTPWNLAVDQRPAAVVQARTAEDVRDVVRFALAGRPAGACRRGPGHGAAPMGDLSGAVLLRTSAMRAVAIDPVARIARAEAGAEWADVVGPATAHGLTALHGSSPDVGVVGYTLGGGIGWMARRHGLATNHVTAVELVDRRGRARARRRRPPPRSVLGHPRGRRQLRRRHRAGVPPVPARGRVRRLAHLAVGADARGDGGVGRVDARPAGRDDLARAGAPAAAAADDPGAAARPPAGRGGGRLDRRPGPRPGADGAAARAGRRDGHLRRGPGGRPAHTCTRTPRSPSRASATAR